jgi:hypothetical protein
LERWSLLTKRCWSTSRSDGTRTRDLRRDRPRGLGNGRGRATTEGAGWRMTTGLAVGGRMVAGGYEHARSGRSGVFLESVPVRRAVAVRVLHRPSRPLCPCGNGLKPWVRRARKPPVLRNRAAPGAALEIGRAGRVRRNRLERPTSGVTGLSYRGLRGSRVVRSQETRHLPVSDGASVGTVRRCDLK